MKTSLTKEFEVKQGPDIVWKYLINPEEVVECVPGVSIDEKVSEGVYKGKVGMKFGPISANYNADIIYDDIDESNQTIKLIGKGVDTKGMGNAEMQLNLDLSLKDDGGSHVDAVMDVTINGKIAQFGSRLVHDVSNQLFKQFVDNFTKKLEGVEITEADQNVKAGGVLKSVVQGIFSGGKKDT
jgi:carbon monoxide dehydrogenase subunit G